MDTTRRNTFGLIETKGLVCALEAANIMLQSANVSLVACKQLGSGLVTVIIRGDMSSVKIATDAGAAAAAKIGKVKAVHILPRLHADIEHYLLTGDTDDN